MKSFQAKLTSKGQLTLPIEIRQSLGVGPGDRIEFYLHHTGEIFVHARNKPASAIFGNGAAYARPVTPQQSEPLVGQAISARGEPTRRRKGADRRRKAG